jgi:hypothetical protein
MHSFPVCWLFIKTDDRSKYFLRTVWCTDRQYSFGTLHRQWNRAINISTTQVMPSDL